MVLWTVDSFEIQKLVLLFSLISATFGYLMGKYSQKQIIAFLNWLLVDTPTKEAKN